MKYLNKSFCDVYIYTYGICNIFIYLNYVQTSNKHVTIEEDFFFGNKNNDSSTKKGLV